MADNDQTATSIRRAFTSLSAAKPGFPVSFREAERQGGPKHGSVFSIYGALTLCPTLYRLNGTMRVVQEQFFGFYALRRAIRGVLLAVNHLVGAEHTLTQRVFGPSVVLAYSAAFHSLHALLALRGRVYTDSFLWPLSSHDSKPPPAAAVLLTRGGSWKVEGRPRSHTKRWLEVHRQFGPSIDDLPQCFYTMFQYYNAEALHRPPPEFEQSLPARFRQPPPTIAECLQELLIRIADSRHTALYQTFGSDPWVVERQVNREQFDSSGIEQHAATMLRFATELMSESAEEVLTLIHRLTVSPEVRGYLFLCSYFPWFDSPKTSMVGHETLREQITELQAWVLDSEALSKAG